MSRTAVVVHVPEAEPLVGELRLRHTYDAPAGMPAHVTLLFPFVPASSLSPEVEARLADIVGEVEAFELTFARTARFPTVLYLEPEPSEPFAALTRALVTAWPEHPPYEGAVDVVIPHLTVAESEDGELLDGLAMQVEPRLPLEARVSEAKLFEEDAAGRWHERSRVPLAR
ncbi:MAG TPA: 2'-5' RNA ligase family protein [Gaiellaceae bacterium]